MEKETIKVAVIDGDKDFFSFVEYCIAFEEKKDIIEVRHFKTFDQLPKNWPPDIFVIGDEESSKTLNIIDSINASLPCSPYILVASETTDPEYLKNLIQKNITGMLSKNNKDCSVLINIIEKTVQTQSALCHIKDLMRKLP